MPKFLVNLGRMVREETTVIVEAASESLIEENLKSLFCAVELSEPAWQPDNEWGAEMSDTSAISELDADEVAGYIVTEDGAEKKEN